jgi:hypothetical protein
LFDHDGESDVQIVTAILRFFRSPAVHLAPAHALFDAIIAPIPVSDWKIKGDAMAIGLVDSAARLGCRFLFSRHCVQSYPRIHLFFKAIVGE